MRIRHIRIGENSLVHAVRSDQPFEVLLSFDGNPVGIVRPRQLGGVAPAVDLGNLGRGEGDHLHPRILSKNHVEIVKVASRCPENKYPSP